MLLVMSHGVLMDHFLLILHKQPETSKSDISFFGSLNHLLSLNEPYYVTFMQS